MGRAGKPDEIAGGISGFSPTMPATPPALRPESPAGTDSAGKYCAHIPDNYANTCGGDDDAVVGYFDTFDIGVQADLLCTYALCEQRGTWCMPPLTLLSKMKSGSTRSLNLPALAAIMSACRRENAYAGW